MPDNIYNAIKTHILNTSENDSTIANNDTNLTNSYTDNLSPFEFEPFSGLADLQNSNHQIVPYTNPNQQYLWDVNLTNQIDTFNQPLNSYTWNTQPFDADWNTTVISSFPSPVFQEAVVQKTENKKSVPKKPKKKKPAPENIVDNIVLAEDI